MRQDDVTIVVFSDTVGLSDILGVKSEECGWNVEIHSTVDSALGVLGGRNVELLIAVQNENEAQTIELLNSASLRSPATARILLVDSVRKDTIAAQTTIAHQVLSLSNSNRLFSTISHLIELRNWNAPTKLVELATSITSAPSDELIVKRLRAHLEAYPSDLTSAEYIIGRDVGLSIKLAQLRNLYCGDSSQNLKLSTSLFQDLASTSNLYNRAEELGQSIANLNSLSIELAQSSRYIAEIRHGSRSVTERAYLAGLISNVGKMVLMQQRTVEYQRALTLVGQKQINASAAEHEVFGFDQAELGIHLLTLWGFPRPIIRTLHLHDVSRQLDRLAIQPVAAAILTESLVEEAFAIEK